MTPLGKFVKWIGVPAIVAAVGFFLVGPKLGRDVLEKLKVPAITNVLPEEPAEAGDAADEGPGVDISVRPVD